MKVPTNKEWFRSRIDGEVGKNIEVRPAKGPLLAVPSDGLLGFVPGEIVEAASDITAGLGVARVICDAGTELRVTGPSGNSLHPIRVEKTDGSSWACAVSASDIRKPNAEPSRRPGGLESDKT